MPNIGELSLEQRVALLEVSVKNILDSLGGPLPGIPAKLVVSSPFDPTVYGGFGTGWFDATGFATKYGTLGHYHTGSDLNLPNYQDSGKKVYAVADGILRFAGIVSGWEGRVVVIEHNDAGELVWTRYAHIDLDAALPVIGSPILRGKLLGRIADYNHNGPQSDHLHLDVCRINLGENPGDWPALNLNRVKTDYIDPPTWIKAHQPAGAS